MKQFPQAILLDSQPSNALRDGARHVWERKNQLRGRDHLTGFCCPSEKIQ